MGRHLKEGFGYFPLDTNFFYASKKIKALRRAHGAVGIAVYINILCRVYAVGYYYQFDDFNDLAKDIAEDIVGEREQIRHIAAKTAETLHYMAELGLIDRDLFEMNVISSRAIQEQFAESVRKAKRNTKIDSYNLVGVKSAIPENGISSEEMRIYSEEMQENSEESTQSKLKENTTTTTCLVCTHARGEKNDSFTQPVENSYVPPTWSEVAIYIRKEFELSHVESVSQAEKFIAWNAKRHWDCLPDWQLAANLWVARMDEFQRN